MAEDGNADEGPGHSREDEVVSLEPSLTSDCEPPQMGGEDKLTTSGETPQEDIPEAVAMKGQENM